MCSATVPESYVTRHALAIEGPLREYYLVGPQETSDASAWRSPRISYSTQTALLGSWAMRL
jgi:hypothetical protein